MKVSASQDSQVFGMFQRALRNMPRAEKFALAFADWGKIQQEKKLDKGALQAKHQLVSSAAGVIVGAFWCVEAPWPKSIAKMQ